MATFKPVVEDYRFGCWTVTATKCHILASEGPERQTYVRFIAFCHKVLVAIFFTIATVSFYFDDIVSLNF